MARSHNEEKETDNQGCSKKIKTSNAEKDTVKIELGWMHYNINQYTQVRSRNGGGTRQLQISKNAGKKEIIQLAEDLFFPEGRSSKGRLTDMDCDLTNF